MSDAAVRDGRMRFALAAVIAFLAFAVFLPSMQNGFVDWDDDLYVYNNPWLRAKGPAFITWAWTNLISGSWFPLTWMSYALDHSVWGADPAGYHLTNSILHGANTFLVVWLVFLLFEAAKANGALSPASAARGSRDMLVAGGIAGILFGLHPLRVESVAWIAERKDVLCAFFFLLGLTAYLAYARTREHAPAADAGAAFPVNARYVLTLVLFMLAIASKPMAVTFPVVLLILDWYPLNRITSRRRLVPVLAEKIPFVALSLAVSLVTIKAQSSAGYLLYRQAVPLTDRLLVAAEALVLYLRNLIVPTGLMPLYPYPSHITLLSLRYLFATAFVCGAFAIAVLLAKKQKIWLAAGGYYLVTLLPVLGFIQAGEQSMADRYTYLPCLGPVIAAGTIAARGWVWADSLRRWRSFVMYAACGAALAGTLVLALLTMKQIGIWHDSVTLWDHVIRHEPDRLYIAYNNRGVGYKDRGMYDRAIADYTKAIELNPRDARPYVNRAIAYAETNQPGRAIPDFDAVISREPDNADAYAGRGLALAQAGRFDEAIEDCSIALLLRPGHADAYLNRGVAYERDGRLVQALDDYGRAAALNPYDHLAYVNRGNILGTMGRYPEAIDDYTKALDLKPDLAKTYLDRGGLYLKTGSAGRAAADFQQACMLGSEDGCAALRIVKGRPGA